MSQNELPIWAEKYRPRHIADCVLPKELKEKFTKFAKNKTFPNLLLSGPGGIGKTSIAKALLEEIGADYMLINASLKGNIDTLRNDIQTYASSISLMGGRKYVLLDEADYLTSATQPALRNFMEEFSRTTGFILTCNFKNKIIEPLHSRCSTIDFIIPASQSMKLKIQFLKYLCQILDKENVNYSKEKIAELIEVYYPDWRRTINELQTLAMQTEGEISSDLIIKKEIGINELIDYLRDKNFTAMRRYVGEHSDIDSQDFFREFYDKAIDICKDSPSAAQLILLIGKYQFQSYFCPDKELNLASFLVEVMIEVEFL